MLVFRARTQPELPNRRHLTAKRVAVEFGLIAMRISPIYPSMNSDDQHMTTTNDPDCLAAKIARRTNALMRFSIFRFRIAIVLLVGAFWPPHNLVAQINLNPPNQLLPTVQNRTPQSYQQPPSADAGATSAIMNGPQRTVGQPNLRIAQQPVGNPQQPSNVPVSPQVATPVSDALSITPDAVMTYIQQLQAATDLEATLKQTLIASFEAILAEMKSRAESEKVTKEFLAAYEAAPAATAETKKRKENPQPRRVYFDGTLESSRIETLQKYQLEIQAFAQSAMDGRLRVEAAMVSRDARRKEIPRQIAEDKATIAKLNEELALSPAEGVDPRVREVNTLLLRSKILSLNERVRKFEQEQRTFDAELELLPVRKEVLLAEEKFQLAKLKEVKDELGKRRENKIAEQKRTLVELVAQSVPDIKVRAESLLKRSDDWLQLAKQNASLRMEEDSALSELKLWTDRYKMMKERISPGSSRHVTNFNSWVGLMLRKQRNELPDLNRLGSKLRDYKTRILSTETLILELDDWKTSSTISEEPIGESNARTDSIEQFAFAPLHEQKRMLLAMERKLVDEF